MRFFDQEKITLVFPEFSSEVSKCRWILVFPEFSSEVTNVSENVGGLHYTDRKEK